MEIPPQSKKITVIGICGAGKTTLSKELGQLLNIPIYHLDKLFWTPGWRPAESEDFLKQVDQVIAQEQWIIDGNFTSVLLRRLAHADTVIYLDFNRFTAIGRVLKRVLQNLGKTRPDMPDGCPEKIDFEFLKYIWRFPQTKRLENEALLRSFGNQVHIIRLKNSSQLNRFMQSVRSHGGIARS